MPKVPARLKQDLERRDKTPLGEGGLVRLQRIAMGQGIARNMRLVVMEDGRYYEARNTGGRRRPGGRLQRAIAG
jgi:hypothetical protein